MEKITTLGGGKFPPTYLPLYITASPNYIRISCGPLAGDLNSTCIARIGRHGENGKFNHSPILHFSHHNHNLVVWTECKLIVTDAYSYTDEECILGVSSSALCVVNEWQLAITT